MFTYRPVNVTSHLTATANTAAVADTTTATSFLATTHLSYQDTFPFAGNCVPVLMCQ
jgi:hypothetical protein